MKPRKPPAELSAAGKALWTKIADEIELDEPAALLLSTLCQSFDRLQEARAILRKDGILILDRFGIQKPHPACAIERDSITAMTRCWRLLGFDLAPPTEGR